MKRILSVLLAVSLILGMFVFALPAQAAPECSGGSGCPSNGYSDVPGPSNWAHTGIDFCIDAGYMGSTSTKTLTFEPKTLVSRAMVASIMYRIAGAPSGVSYKATFADVPAGKWFTTAIEWAAQNGLASGKGNGIFDPNGNVTRQELAVFMYKLAEYEGANVNGRNELSNFVDASKVPSWAKMYVQWAVDAGLISGKASGGKTYLAPKDNATRAEFASIIMRFAEQTAPIPPTPPIQLDPLEIVNQPKSVTIDEGNAATLSVSVSGGEIPYSYQWYNKNILISGATGEELITTEAGNYTCTITDSAGNSVTSNTATVTVNVPDPLVITKQPQGATIEVGNTVTLSVSVSGGVAPYTYQWMNGGTVIAGATNATYVTGEAGNYSCIVTDSKGHSVASSVATVTVKTPDPLVITKQPQGATIEVGDTVTLSVAVSGGVAPYTYQWMNAGVTIAGATSATYVAREAGNYSCAVTDSKGNAVVSNVATVIVSVPQGGELTVTRQPVGGEIQIGSAINMSVGIAGGTKPYSYQWYKDGVAIPGAIYMSYVATQAGKYFCAVFDATGYSVITSVAIVTVETVKYDIIYDVVGSDSYLRRTGVENLNPDYYTTEAGLVLRNLSVEGYVFEGWYDGPGANASQVKEIRPGETGTKYLYAHWSLIEYTVQFKSSLFLEEREKKYTVDKGVTLPTPKLSSYVFAGWSDEEGNLYRSTTIPAGTTGNITLTANWTSERNKTWTKPVLDAPIIEIDEENNVILFAYEIGEIQNVPLYTIKDFGYIAGDGITKTEKTTYSVTISESMMLSYAKSVAKATTESSNWTLSSNWNEVTSVDEQWCRENGKVVEDADTVAKSSSNNWNISSGLSGSAESTSLTTNQDGWENEVKITAEHEHTDSETTSDKDTTNDSWHIDPKLTYTPKSSSFDIGISEIGSIGVSQSGGWGGEIGGGYEHSWGHEHDESETHSDKNTSGVELGGKDTHSDLKTESTTFNTAWNSSESYGGSNTNSSTKSHSTALSEKICESYGYGKSYSTGGTSGSSQGLTSSQSEEDEYASSVTYSTVTSKEVTSEWTTQATKPGYHRWVVAGTAHVFAVVGYDMSKQTYFVYTYSVMDDETHEFEDYSYTTARYNDEENGVISFEVPFEVAEYVTELTSWSKGLKVDQTTGTIIGYSGTDDCVVIPEYWNVGNGDVVKITGVSSNAFKGNTNIKAVILSDFITEIPDSAFEGCTALIGVTGGNVTKIGNNAFSGCTSVEDVGIRSKVTYLGQHAFDGVERIIVYANNAGVVEASANSGANQIIICLDSINNGAEALRGKSISIPAGTKYFEFNGLNRTYQDFSISSDANITVINKTNLVCSGSIPLLTTSPEVVLNQSSFNASGIALVLAADHTHLGLQSTIAVTSSATNAMLCKDLSLYEANENVEGKLVVSVKLLICGEIEGKELLTYGAYEKIDAATFDKLLHSYRLYFDANGGTCEEISREVPNGTALGALPTPTRTYFTFDGWYTEKTGGTKVTASTVFSSGLDVTVYAHWSPSSYTASWSAGTGTTITVSRTASPYANAATGALSSGATVYFGDKLTVTYTAKTGYNLATSGSTEITVSSNVTSSTIYATAAVKEYTLTYSSGSNYTITVNRTSSPLKGASTGNLSSGATIYYNDVLSVTYTPATGYSIDTSGGKSYTVTNNIGTDKIYATVTPNSYTYSIVYKSSKGTNLGSSSATYKFGTTNTITPPAKSGYSTPSSQSVKWDSTSKTITFIYPPLPVDYTVKSGTICTSPKLSYSATLQYQNRTATSVQVRVAWTTTIGSGSWTVYGQKVKATVGSSSSTATVADFNTWKSSSSSARSSSGTTGWITVPLSTTNATSVNVGIYYYQTNSNNTDMTANYGEAGLSTTWSMSIPAY